MIGTTSSLKETADVRITAARMILVSQLPIYPWSRMVPVLLSGIAEMKYDEFSNRVYKISPGEMGDAFGFSVGEVVAGMKQKLHFAVLCFFDGHCAIINFAQKGARTSFDGDKPREIGELIKPILYAIDKFP